MIKAAIFDMYETLITLYTSTPYFGCHMARDAGIPEDEFRKLWDPSEDDRSIGNVTLEEVLELILKDQQCFSKELHEQIVAKRIAFKEECFEHLHKEVIPMLSSIKERGVKIGLISNCFSEEATAIRNSILFPYFDALYLSYEQRIQKPNPEIFHRCMNSLQVKAEECLYIGDGGSSELETASQLGMTALQAVWYLKEQKPHQTGRKEGFIQLEEPMEVLHYIL